MPGAKTNREHTVDCRRHASCRGHFSRCLLPKSLRMLSSHRHTHKHTHTHTHTHIHTHSIRSSSERYPRHTHTLVLDFNDCRRAVDTSAPKFLYVSWVGEGAPATIKAKANSHSPIIARQVSATSPTHGLAITWDPSVCCITGRNA